MKIEIEIPEGYMLDGYTVKPVPIPLTFAPSHAVCSPQPYIPYIPPYIPPYVPNQSFISCDTASGL